MPDLVFKSRGMQSMEAKLGRPIGLYLADKYGQGLSQEQIAAELGINRATVGRLLSGERGVGLGLALRICRRLLISPEDLLLHEPRRH